MAEKRHAPRSGACRHFMQLPAIAPGKRFTLPRPTGSGDALLLARHAGTVLDHHTIYDRIWGYDFGPDSKALAVYIGYLRRKLEDAGESRLIHTVRGVGYALRTA